MKQFYAKLREITKEAGIEKTGTAPGSIGGFAFHSIDAIEEHLKHLFTKHGIQTEVDVMECQDIPAKGNQRGVRVIGTITYTNVDDPEQTSMMRWIGEGFDASDKAIGKGIAYGLKNHYLAMFHLKGQPDNEATPVESLPEMTKTEKLEEFLSSQPNTDIKMAGVLALELFGTKDIEKLNNNQLRDLCVSVKALEESAEETTEESGS